MSAKLELTQLGDSVPLRSPFDVDYKVQCRGHLAGERGRAETGKRSQRLKPGGHVRKTARVQGAGTAVVPGVERGEQRRNLCATALPEHDPIRTHPQCLSQEFIECHHAHSLRARLPSFQRDSVRVLEPKLGDVFDRDDALPRRYAVEQCGKKRCFPATGAAGDQEVSPARHRCSQRVRRPCTAQAPGDEPVEPERRDTRNPYRDDSPRDRDRWQHRVHPDPVSQPNIGTRMELIKMPPARGDERDGKPVHSFGLGPPPRHPIQRTAPVEPELTDAAPHLHEQIT